jgi:hypothetical protein
VVKKIDMSTDTQSAWEAKMKAPSSLSWADDDEDDYFVPDSWESPYLNKSENIQTVTFQAVPIVRQIESRFMPKPAPVVVKRKMRDENEQKTPTKNPLVEVAVDKMYGILRPLHAKLIGFILLQIIKQKPITYNMSLDEMEASLAQYEVHKILKTYKFKESEILEIVKALCELFEKRLYSDTLKMSIRSASRISTTASLVDLATSVKTNIKKLQACGSDRAIMKDVFETMMIDFLKEQEKTIPSSGRKKKEANLEGWTSV